MTRTAALAAALALAALTALASATPAAAAGWWCSDHPQGTWQTQGFYVQNDAWNGGHGPQRICAGSYHTIHVRSDQPTGNTEIMTYPDVSGLYTGTDRPVSAFTAIWNRFRERMPGDVSGEAADDIWLNHWSIEIMMWVDTHHQDPSYLPRIGTATIWGQRWLVYRNGSEFIFKLDHNETSGVTHVLSAIRWLTARGYVPASAGLTAVQFGWEIAGTNGPEGFDLLAYELHGVMR